MSSIVPADSIEQIVGVKRDRFAHHGRAVSAEQTVYILHSQRCKDSGADLRECSFSLALDLGIDPQHWNSYEDLPVVLAVQRGRLVPVGESGYGYIDGPDGQGPKPT